MPTSVIIVLHLLTSLSSPLVDEATEPLAFPPTVVTTQEKLDWLTAEIDRADQSVEAEADRPLPEQRESVYRAILARMSNLLRLIKTLPGRLPRIEGRANDTITKANAGLERVANAALKIGMDPEQVRRIRGDPNRTTETQTATGTRQQWHYGSTVLSFDNGRLVEIRQSLKGE